MKFNRKLARLESLYGVKTNKAVEAEPLQISDFIHHIFENSSKYNVEDINKDWFRSVCSKNPDTATKIVKNVLMENGFNVSSKSIVEGIEIFKIDNE